MIKNMILSILGILLLGQFCRFGMPWWGLAPIAFIVSWIFRLPGLGAFFSGLIAGALLWGSAAYFPDAANGSALSAKVGQIFQGISSSGLLYVTALIGGLLGGMGALTGQWARDMFSKPDRIYYGKRRKSGRYR